MTPPIDSLTPKIRALVSRDRQGRPPARRLTDAHVEALAAVATGQRVPGEDVSAPRAISALAEGASEQALPVLQSILEDGSRPQPDQVSAARALGSIGTVPAETIVLRQLPTAAPRVQQELLASLGRCGSPDAAMALEGLTVVDDDALRRQLGLTRALIAHRHGLDGPFLPETDAAGRPRGRAGGRAQVSLSLKSAATTAADLRRLNGPVYSIALAPRALGLKCGPIDWTVFLDAALGATAADMAPLFERPWLAGVVAQRYPTGEGLATRLILLSRPAGKEVRLELARGDGTVVYVGAVRRVKDGLAFTITDAERAAAAPTHLAGTVGSRGVTLTTAVASTARRGVRDVLDVEIPR